MEEFEPDTDHRIWQVVAAIPQGKVSTYGEIAKRAGMARAARRVGLALRRLPKNSRIPWHRVINAQGRISLRGSEPSATQKKRLTAEGIVFTESGTINLRRYGW